MRAFPGTDANDAIGRWLLSLPYAQRQKLFRLADYMNGKRRRQEAPMQDRAPNLAEKYHGGICVFSAGKVSPEADRIAELLAAIAQRLGARFEESKAA